MKENNMKKQNLINSRKIETTIALSVKPSIMIGITQEDLIELKSGESTVLNNGSIAKNTGFSNIKIDKKNNIALCDHGLGTLTITEITNE